MEIRFPIVAAVLDAGIAIAAVAELHVVIGFGVVLPVVDGLRAASLEYCFAWEASYQHCRTHR